MYNISESDTKINYKIAYEIDSNAYVRQINYTDSGGVEVNLIPASEYSIETNVPNTNVNYEELNRVAQLPFQQKVDWLKTQFAAIRTPWEEGHIKIKIRRQSVLQVMHVNDITFILCFFVISQVC